MDLFCIPRNGDNEDDTRLSAFLLEHKWSVRPKTNVAQAVLKEYQYWNWKFDRNKIMHQLAAEYYEFRAFWYSFFPLLMVTTFISFCSFLVTGREDQSNIDLVGKNMTVQLDKTSTNPSDDTFFPLIPAEQLNIIVGMLGILSAFLASLSRHLNYQSKADMHRSAASTLKEICDSISFDQSPVKQKYRVVKQKEREDSIRSNDGDEDNANASSNTNTNTNTNDDDDDNDDGLGIQIASHKAKFETMEKACTDPVPSEIVQAFTILNELFDSLPFRVKKKLYKRYYHGLWREFITRRGCGCCFLFPIFPHSIPIIDVEELFGSQIRKDVESLMKYHEKEDKEHYDESSPLLQKQGGDTPSGSDSPPDTVDVEGGGTSS